MTASPAITLEGIEARFDHIDERFGEVMSALDSLGKSMDSMGKSTHKAIYALQEAHMQHFQITQDIQRRVVVLEDSVGDVQESLDFLTLSEEKDAEATINHELRITRIEKANGIEGSAPTYLSDFE